MPQAPMSENHKNATTSATGVINNSSIGPGDLPGEKMKESLAVPNLWARNRATMTPIEIDEILWFRLGTDNPIPATAEVTETAGVSIPSANARAVANNVCGINKLNLKNE